MITGGDSGIGRAIAVAMAREGAKIAIVYLDEHKDANETRELVKNEGSDAILLAGDVGEEDFCEAAVEATLDQFGRIDILVNNAAEQHETDDIRNIDAKQIERTFRTNVFSMFFMVKHALRHMGRAARSSTRRRSPPIKGHKTLLDYCVHERRHRRADALARRSAGERRHPRERGRAGTDLDAADSRVVRAGARRQARLRRADAAARPAQRGRALLRVPGER